MKAVAFTRDSRQLVTLTDREAKVWDVDTLKLQGTFMPPDRNAGRLMAMAVSPDGKTLAIGGGWAALGLYQYPDGHVGEGSGLIWVWNLRSGKLEKTLEQQEAGDVISLAYSPDGNTLAAGGEFRGYTLWDVAAGKPRANLPAGSYGWAVAFSRDGKTVATGGGDNTPVPWDAKTGALLAALPPHEHLVLALAFSPDGATLASGSYDGSLRFYDLRSRTVRRSLPTGGWVHAVAYSPDGTRLAFGLRREQGALRVLTVSDGL